MIYLEAQNIKKQYSGHEALNDVSIKIPKGCIYGLLGPNGAGKTTLIRIINKITAPDGGQILFQGRPSKRSDIYNIGYLPEERGLYRKMKVGEHVSFLAELRGMSRENIKKQMNIWFEKFGISSWKNNKIETLSKGMQQKVQFITTVIHNPDLLILDEPFSGFDPVNAELLKKEILELKEIGKTIVLSTHNMESVETLCEEITLINKSQVVLDGNVREIRENHRTSTFNLVIATDNFDITSNYFSVQEKQATPMGVKLKVKIKPDISNSIMLKDLASKYEIISFEEEMPSMNEVFINTVTQK